MRLARHPHEPDGAPVRLNYEDTVLDEEDIPKVTAVFLRLMPFRAPETLERPLCGRVADTPLTGTKSSGR